jgi:hypothetical protein
MNGFAEECRCSEAACGKLVAILQVGGFLGLGGHLIATPYENLNISNDGRKITLAGTSKETLGKLPELEYKK